jgi:hypothetical protein
LHEWIAWTVSNHMGMKALFGLHEWIEVGGRISGGVLSNARPEVSTRRYEWSSLWTGFVSISPNLG